MDARSPRLRVGLILAAAVFATGALAAVMADAMQPAPSPVPTGSPRAVPPGATAPIPQPPAGRQLVPAPIDRLEIRIRESAPPQYTLSITAGLPSGCAQKDSHHWSRTGEAISVTVMNSMPRGNPICTMIYGMYELNIDLGSGYTRGVTYTVRVNDATTSFVAQ